MSSMASPCRSGRPRPDRAGTAPSAATAAHAACGMNVSTRGRDGATSVPCCAARVRRAPARRYSAASQMARARWGRAGDAPRPARRALPDLVVAPAIGPLEVRRGTAHHRRAAQHDRVHRLHVVAGQVVDVERRLEARPVVGIGEAARGAEAIAAVAMRPTRAAAYGVVSRRQYSVSSSYSVTSVGPCPTGGRSGRAAPRSARTAPGCES